MKSYISLHKLLLAAGILFSLLAGCNAPAIETPTSLSSPTLPALPTSTPVSLQTLSPTLPIASTLSPAVKIWETSGDPNDLNRPTEIAIDQQGNIYIVDGGNHRVLKYDRDGNFLLMWGSQGTGDGQFVFNVPPAHYGSLTVDREGSVYVTDRNNRIQKFNSEGTFLMKFGGTGYADGEFAALYGIAVDDQGNIYTTDWIKHDVQKFDMNGHFLEKWEVPSCKLGGTSTPHNLVINAQGQIYITNHTGNCVQKFDAQGNLLQQWGEGGEADGQLNKVLSLALDAEGNTYVVDNENGRVQKFDSNGDFLASFGPFEYPTGIAVDREGHLYVTQIVVGSLQKIRLE